MNRHCYAAIADWTYCCLMTRTTGPK